MTERLYYTDPDLLEFSSEITETGNAGERYFTVLKASAFYPTSGGQQFDTGFLNDIPVIKVVEDEAHLVRHLTAKPVGQAGDHVKGRIDKERRTRHRRQHTAQHILSQAFIQTARAETVSVHLGEDYGAVELNRDSLDEKDLMEAETFANRIVGESLPIDILFVSVDEIDRIPLRKVPDRSGTLRVIKIGELDYSACGGTHCRRTSEVLCVKLVGTEKIRGRLLVRFLSGEQALEDYAMRYNVTSQLSQSLTCHVSDLPGKFEKLAEENRTLRRDVSEMQKELIPIKASQLSNMARPAGSCQLVVCDIGVFDSKALGQLAGLVASQIGGVALLYSEGRAIIATSEASGCDAGAMARELVSSQGLKGGGNIRQAQLGGAQAERLPLYTEIVTKLMSHG